MEGEKPSLYAEHSVYTPRQLRADISTFLKASNPSFSAEKQDVDDRRLVSLSVSLESYRSGHNGAVLKTVRRQRHRGSNPLLSATKYGSP